MKCKHSCSIRYAGKFEGVQEKANKNSAPEDPGALSLLQD
jgi:hypothetical protein